MGIGEGPAVINWQLKDAATVCWKFKMENYLFKPYPFPFAFPEKDQTSGVPYITLTDNKSYFVTIQYWDHTRRGWLIMSTEKVIGPEIKDKVLAHVGPMGFDEKLAFFKDFNTCPAGKDEL